MRVWGYGVGGIVEYIVCCGGYNDGECDRDGVCCRRTGNDCVGYYVGDVMYLVLLVLY